jgi:hypothetical protein
MLEILHDVIKEMTEEEETDISEIPDIEDIQSILKEKDDFWYEFTNSTWIHIQEVSEQNIERIVNSTEKIAIPLSESGIINDFVSKIARLSGDDPLDGDKTAKIVYKLHDKLDRFYGNEPAEKFAHVSWTIGDIFEEADSLDVPLCAEEAEEFIKSHEDDIKESMIKAGWNVISNALQQRKKHEKKECENSC